MGNSPRVALVWRTSCYFTQRLILMGGAATPHHLTYFPTANPPPAKSNESCPAFSNFSRSRVVRDLYRVLTALRSAIRLSIRQTLSNDALQSLRGALRVIDT